jgi:hypothetical protein
MLNVTPAHPVSKTAVIGILSIVTVIIEALAVVYINWRSCSHSIGVTDCGNGAGVSMFRLHA